MLLLKLLLVAVTFLGMLYALNQTYDKQKLETAKSRLVSLWVEISDHSFPAGFNLVNSKILGFFKSARLKILSTLTVILSALAIFIPAEAFLLPQFDVPLEITTLFAHKTNGARIVQMTDLQKRVQSYEISTQRNTECIIPDHAFPHESMSFSDYERLFKSLLDNSKNLDRAIEVFARRSELKFRITSFMGEFLAIVTIACVFVFAFWVSTGLSIFLSSFFVKTKFSVFMIFATMITSSILVPILIPTIISIVFFAAVDIIIPSYRIELFYDELTYRSIFFYFYKIYIMSFDLIFNRSAIFVAALLSFKDVFNQSLWERLIEQLFLTIKYVFMSIYNLLSNVFSFDFYRLSELDATSLILNWTVLSDLIFSVTMVLTVVLNIMIAKNRTLWNSIANVIQLVAESPQGPFIAISLAISAAIYTVIGWF